MWTRKVTWKIIPVISHLPQHLWPQNLTRLSINMRSFHPWSHTNLWTPGYMRSLDKLKTLFLHYQNGYGHQTYMQWGVSFHRVTRPFYQMVLQGQVANQMHISTNYRNDYGHRAWQGGYIQWGASFHKVLRSLDHVVLQGHVTN